ncbi:MAG: Cyclic pyranopterin phosphate synthase (MoaA) [uncultured Thermomicrobiales bacterium]|uniref:GTP 3',8-cyclase n=1 Tax=uncultured Thermomicrobiales bacterium TaxID=1645740 RepID=A0A6J4UHL6_9BACT|nr:MAG: Cyclic pyranopterin phosphate synthase (MoaA) [uncultured Thermomicrobiales bacterium]
MVGAVMAPPSSPLRFEPQPRAARDAFGRAMTYLRISLTDRCNFRCVYCMPALGMKFQPRDELLTDDELVRVVRLCAKTGFTKLRLTGGEPTIRPRIVELVRAMKATPGIEELSMTTNGLLLNRLADPLAGAGLDRVNISIDTLDPDKFKLMTRGGRLDLVWQGIEAADAAGLRPIKLNTVVMRGQNDAEVGEMAALTLANAWQVRFLEIMPLEGVGAVHDEGLVTSEETQERLEARFGPLTPVEVPPGDPARVWRIPGAVGTVGFISPVSAPFCAACNRVRLTADGKLRLCLLRPDEVDLRDLMRAGADDAALELQMRAGIWRKPWGHGLAEGERETVRGMSQIGG